MFFFQDLEVDYIVYCNYFLNKIYKKFWLEKSYEGLIKQEEIKLVLFINEMILYIEMLEDFIDKLIYLVKLEQINFV